MGKLQRIEAEVSAEMAAGLRSAVDAGAYGSINDVVQEALEGWLAGERPAALSLDDLRGMVDDGGVGEGLDAERFFDELDARAIPGRAAGWVWHPSNSARCRSDLLFD